MRRVLELGSGGGNSAFHLKRWFELTLTDRSPDMLDLSRRLNPECEHLQGDMRSLRLEREFDGVFVHDAVMYMASEEDLRATIATAVAHCRPGGVLLFLPDCVAETFYEYEHDGGHDGEDGRSLRYHEVVTDPDPKDSTYQVAFEVRLRDAAGSERLERETHTYGLFQIADWMRWLTEAGLRAEAIRSDLGGDDVPNSYQFVGVKD